MNRRESRTIIELAEILVDAHRRIEARTGKPLGVRTKNAITKRLLKIYDVNIAKPLVLVTKIDFVSSGCGAC